MICLQLTSINSCPGFTPCMLSFHTELFVILQMYHAILMPSFIPIWIAPYTYTHTSLCLFICLVNFSFVNSHLPGYFFREALSDLSGQNLMLPSCIFILFMGLSLSISVWYTFQINDSQNSMFLRIISGSCKNSVMGPNIRNSNSLDQDKI